ncbi:hypothetical protein EON83_01270 [bacterium]|nr:MAG: hypothetical protein EON83_01270 [bacterium]
MARHNLSLLAAFVSICFIFSGAVLYAVRQAKGDSVAAHQVGASFYTYLHRHDYEGARSLLTRERQLVISKATLAQYVNKFEKKHGSLVKWEVAQVPTMYGSRISIFPRYVEESRLMTGTNGTSGAGMLQIQPEDGQWKVARISIVP